MKFGVIQPASATAALHEFDDLNLALDFVGLKPGTVDHGAVSQGIGVVVHEFSLHLPTAQQHYFSIGKGLFAGNAVLYGVGMVGETVDLDKLPPIMFYRDTEQVEYAIKAGAVLRPQMAVNGVVLWQWPQPPPQDIAEAMKEK